MSRTNSQLTIYHNPRCSKSREALALLRERGLEPSVIEYLKTPPSATDLRVLVKKLGLKPEELVRKGEEIFKTKYAGRVLSDAQWTEALAEDPILIERPIVVSGEKAVVGRPPGRVLELL